MANRPDGSVERSLAQHPSYLNTSPGIPLTCRLCQPIWNGGLGFCISSQAPDGAEAAGFLETGVHVSCPLPQAVGAWQLVVKTVGGFAGADYPGREGREDPSSSGWGCNREASKGEERGNPPVPPGQSRHHAVPGPSFFLFLWCLETEPWGMTTERDTMSKLGASFSLPLCPSLAQPIHAFIYSTNVYGTG